MSEDDVTVLRERIEDALARLAQIIGPEETLDYVQWITERMREELDER